MKNKLNRRDFLRATATAGALAATSTKVLGAPAVRRSGFKPVVIASGNGNVYRNGGTETCVELAFRRMTAGDDVLDSLIAGVNIVELDPEEAGVGFGGLPDGDGNVVLDSCCMHGPRKQAGAWQLYRGCGHRLWSLRQSRLQPTTIYWWIRARSVLHVIWVSPSKMISTLPCREVAGWNGNGERIRDTISTRSSALKSV